MERALKNKVLSGGSTSIGYNLRVRRDEIDRFVTYFCDIYIDRYGFLYIQAPGGVNIVRLVQG